MATPVTQGNTNPLYTLAKTTYDTTRSLVQTIWDLRQKLYPHPFEGNCANRLLPQKTNPYKMAKLASLIETVIHIRLLTAKVIEEKYPDTPLLYAYVITAQFRIGGLEELCASIFDSLSRALIEHNSQDRDIIWITLTNENRTLSHPLLILTKAGKNLRVKLEKYTNDSLSNFTATLQKDQDAIAIDPAFGVFPLFKRDDEQNQKSSNYLIKNSLVNIYDYDMCIDAPKEQAHLNNRMNTLTARTQEIFKELEKRISQSQFVNEGFKVTKQILEPFRLLIEKSCKDIAPNAEYFIYISPQPKVCIFLKNPMGNPKEKLALWRVIQLLLFLSYPLDVEFSENGVKIFITEYLMPEQLKQGQQKTAANS